MATPIRFFTDEHIARAVADGLRQRGIDVLTAHEADLLGGSDIEILARATEEARVIVTQDADFLRMHSEGAEHPGIVIAPQAAAIGAIIRFLVLVHEVYTAEEFHGSVEFI